MAIVSTMNKDVLRKSKVLHNPLVLVTLSCPLPCCCFCRTVDDQRVALLLILTLSYN